MIPTRTASPAESSTTPKRNHVVHGWLSAEDYIAIEKQAIARRMHPDALVAMILSKLARKRSFGAIIENLADQR